MGVEVGVFGTVDMHPIRVFKISRDTSIGPVSVSLIEWGATLTELVLPASNGAATDIVLGYDTLEGYRQGATYFGAVAGRYGNRIRDGRVVLDGRSFQLDQNENGNHLHGGRVGFDQRSWRGAVLDDYSVDFALRSMDGDGGFPGTLDLTVGFAVTAEGGLDIRFAGTTDRVTLCNPVHHTYWNLSGHNSGHVLDQELRFSADFMTPVDDELLATGEIDMVAGTPHDFRLSKPIGRDLRQIQNAGGGRSRDAVAGYDHNYVLRGEAGSLKHCATGYSARSGISMTLYTTEPGVQFYTGGYLGPQVIGKGGAGYCRFAGFTLETQKFPGAPEFGHFPSARLDPDHVYIQLMRFSFENSGPPPPVAPS